MSDELRRHVDRELPDAAETGSGSGDVRDTPDGTGGLGMDGVRSLSSGGGSASGEVTVDGDGGIETEVASGTVTVSPPEIHSAGSPPPGASFSLNLDELYLERIQLDGSLSASGLRLAFDPLPSGSSDFLEVALYRPTAVNEAELVESFTAAPGDLAQVAGETYEFDIDPAVQLEMGGLVIATRLLTATGAVFHGDAADQAVAAARIQTESFSSSSPLPGTLTLPLDGAGGKAPWIELLA